MKHVPLYYRDMARQAESFARFQRIRKIVAEWFLTFVVVACVLMMTGAL